MDEKFDQILSKLDSAKITKGDVVVITAVEGVLTEGGTTEVEEISSTGVKVEVPHGTMKKKPLNR